MTIKAKQYKGVQPSAVLRGLEKYRKQNKSKAYLEQLGARLDEDIFPINFVLERSYQGGLHIPMELQFTEVTSFDRDAIQLFAKLGLDANRIDHWRLLIACVASLLMKAGRAKEPFDIEFKCLAQDVRDQNKEANYSSLAELICKQARTIGQRLRRSPEDAEFDLPSGKKVRVLQAKRFYDKISKVENVRKKLRKLNDSERNPGKRLVREGYLRFALLGAANGGDKDQILRSVAQLVSEQAKIKIV